MNVTGGATDVSTYFVLRLAATGVEATGLTIANFDLQYTRSGVAPTAKVDATALAATDSAHGDNQAIEIDATDQPGLYRVDWPDAAFAAGVKEVILTVKVATCFTEHLRVQIDTPVNVTSIAADQQSAADLKDFADAGYDPSTNKVQGVVLTDTVTTYTGNTPQTGDAFSRLGAPAGASVSADIAAIEAQTDDIGAAGAGLTAVPWNAAWDAEVQSEVADALAVYDPPTKAELDSAVAPLALEATLGTPAGASISADIAAIEAQTDDIGVAGAGLTAVPWNAAWDAEVESEAADALAAYDPPTKAELDSAVAPLALEATAQSILTDTAEIGAAGAGLTVLATAANLATVAGYLDTEIAAILADTNELQTDWANDGRLDLLIDAIKARTDVIAVPTRTGTAQAGAAGTITLDAGASAVDDFYNNQILVITGGTGVGQARIVSDYVGSTKVASVNGNWATNPDATSTFALLGFGAIPGATAPTAAEVRIEMDANSTKLASIEADTQDLQSRVPAALVSGRMDSHMGSAADAVLTAAKFASGAFDAVWSVATRELTAFSASFKAGYALSSAGVQAIWDALTSALATAGSIGKLLVDNINATISSRLASTSYTTPPTVGEIADQVWDEAIAGHAGAGSTGAALSAAGSAGDPWATALPGAYGSGTAGKIVGDNLNATVSSRASQTTADADHDLTQSGIAALNDLSGADVRAAVGLASANLDTQLDALPTAGEVATAVNAPSAAAIADAVWDEDATAHQTQGTFGQAIGDPGADSDTIFGLVNTNLDAAVSTRLATAGYTAPLDAAGTRSAVGLASANLDTQLGDLPTNAELATALDPLPTAAEIRAEIDSNSTKLDVATSTRLATAGYTAPPTADQNADALLDRSAGVETNRTPRQALRLMLASLAGKLSGAATTTVAIRDTNDSKDRITATVDADGNRTAVTLDAS